MSFIDLSKAFSLPVFLVLLLGAHGFGYQITLGYSIFAFLVSLPLSFVLLLGVGCICAWSDDRARARRRVKAAARKLSDCQ
jgi:hypothetical protein